MEAKAEKSARLWVKNKDREIAAKHTRGEVEAMSRRLVALEQSKKDELERVRTYIV